MVPPRRLMLAATAAPAAVVQAVPVADRPDVWTVPADPITPAPPTAEAARPGLAQRIEGMLAGLGATAGEVAATLAAASPSVAGWPGDADMDPLCRWLGRQEPGLLVWLTGDHVHAEQSTEPAELALVALPGPVLAFRAACAAGQHHNLWLPARAAADDVALGPGPAGWGQAFPGLASAAWPRTTPPETAPAAAAVPDPDRSLADAGPGGGRGLAHIAYADAVGHAVDLRGVPVGDCHVAPPSGDDGRSITLTLDPDLVRGSWPGHTGVLLRWSERSGWRLLPQHGGQIDPAHALTFWDARRPGPAGPALPAPDRLAAWVSTLVTGTPAGQVEATLRAADTGLLPAWRAAWPAGGDPAFETALDTYLAHPGHRQTRPVLHPVPGGPFTDDHR